MKRYQVKALRALGADTMYFVMDTVNNVKASAFFSTREEAYMESVKLSLRAMEEV